MQKRVGDGLVTEQKETAEALRLSEARYRSLFDHIQEMICVYEVERDNDGLIIERRLRDANPAFLRAVGVSSLAEIRGRSSGELFGEEWSRMHLPAVREAMASGEARQVESYHPGKQRHYLTTIVPLDRNSYLGTNRDITELKQAQATLRESNLRMEQALLLGRAFTFEWYPETDRVFRSDSCASILKLSGDEAVNDTAASFFRMIHPEDRKRFAELVSSLSPGSDTYVTGYRVLCGDGSEAELEETGQALFDASGRLTRLAGVTTDVTSRKRTEAALRESEAMLRLITDNSPDAIFIKDRDGRWVFINPTVERLMGKPAVALLGKRDDEILTDPEAIQVIHENDRRIMQSGQAEVIEESVETITGKQVYLATKAPWHDRGGSVAGIIGIARDITERKQAEENIRRLNASLERKVAERTSALQASEEKYRSLVETVSDCIWEMDSQGRFTYLSPRFKDLTGHNPEEFLGRRPEELMTEADAAHCSDKFSALLAARQPFSGLKQINIRADGSHSLVEVNGVPVLSPDGAYQGMRGITRDVTERNRLEEELRMTRISVETASDQICWVGEGARIVDVNPAMCSSLGYTREELLQMNIADIDPHYNHEQFCREIMPVIREQGFVKFESEHRTKGGQVVPVEVALNHVPFGREERTCAIARDISERKRYEEELVRARDAADAGNRAKSEFLATMSHEIRTPMNGILGMAQLMEFTVLSEEQSEYMAVIRKSAESLLSLINDILDLSKIEAGKVVLSRSEFSLRESIRDIVNSLQYQIEHKGLTVTCDIPATVPDTLTGDQIRLKQILLNLLGNSLKFTEAGGITISASVTGRQDNTAAIRIVVKDTGIGIRAEDLEKIFSPFSQADSSDKRQYGGTGLGLAICSRLVKLMGGTIEVASDVGVGSTFSVQLPFRVSEARQEHQKRLPAAPAWDGPPLRVLVVDDQDVNLFVVRKILETIGITCVATRDGREALAAWEREPFDLILMDIQMPVMDGIEATQAIRDREKETGGHTPIIALTARALLAERKEIMGHPFDGYVSKPFNLEELLGEMKRCLVPVARVASV